MRTIVMTGVSTGIGYDAAATLVARGCHVFGSVRTAADAARLQDALGKEFTPLLFDVTDDAAVRAAAATVAQAVGDGGLAGLVNNAGIAVAGPAMHLPVAEYRRQFEVNLFGQISVTQAFLPLLGARRACPHPPGRIVNISSVAGKLALPFMSPYAASKHALEAYSDSLRRELMLYGIDVVVIEPGSIQTPIWDKAAREDPAVFGETDYYESLVRMQTFALQNGRTGHPVQTVTRAILTALEAPHPRARYALPNQRLLGWWLPRFAPTRWFDRQIARRLGLTRSDG